MDLPDTRIDLTTYPEFSPSHIPRPHPSGKEIQGKCFLCTYPNSQVLFKFYFQTVFVLLQKPSRARRTLSTSPTGWDCAQLGSRRADGDALPMPEPAFLWSPSASAVMFGTQATRPHIGDRSPGREMAEGVCDGSGLPGGPSQTCGQAAAEEGKWIHSTPTRHFVARQGVALSMVWLWTMRMRCWW